jgi:hypothetical protein
MHLDQYWSIEQKMWFFVKQPQTANLIKIMQLDQYWSIEQKDVVFCQTTTNSNKKLASASVLVVSRKVGKINRYMFFFFKARPWPSLPPPFFEVQPILYFDLTFK